MYDITNEQFLAGCILKEESVIWGLDGIVTGEDFQSDNCRAVYEAAKALAADGEAIDKVSIRTKAARAGVDLPKQYLEELIDITPTTAYFAVYGKRVAEDAKKRRIKELAEQIQSDNTSSADELMEKLQDGALRIEENCNTQKKGFRIITAQELQTADIPPTVFIVDNLLTAGLAAISAPPKYGKSWMMIQLCLSVAGGKSFLGYRTTKGDCLYLALEDTYGRLQSRMNKQLQGSKAPPGFTFTVQAPDLDNGLVGMLENHLKQFPNTRLIVIDTLQKVRNTPGKNESAYGADYRTATPLKEFADKHRLCILLVHHLRKMKDDTDPFNMMSGTNGIFGALDSAIVLTRKNRTDSDTLMSITGRDIDQQEKVICFDKDTCKWGMKGNAEDIQIQKEKQEYNANPTVVTIKRLLQDSGEWRGSATELLGAGRVYTKTTLAPTPQKMSGVLKNLDVLLFENDGISHTTISNGSGAKTHCFCYIEPSVSVPFDEDYL